MEVTSHSLHKNMITDFFINIDESRVFRSALQQAYEKLQYAKGWFIFSDYRRRFVNLCSVLLQICQF